jgi:hypothetical protein
MKPDIQDVYMRRSLGSPRHRGESVPGRCDPESLGGFYRQAGRVDDLVVMVTRRGGAGRAEQLADLDLCGAFTDKPAAHLRAVALALPTLDQCGSVTLAGAVSARSALPGTALLASVNGAVEVAVAPLAGELAPGRVNAVSPGLSRRARPAGPAEAWRKRGAGRTLPTDQESRSTRERAALSVTVMDSSSSTRGSRA